MGARCAVVTHATLLAWCASLPCRVLVTHGVVPALLRCLGRFRSHDAMLAEVYQFAGATYNFALVQHSLAALANILEVGRSVRGRAVTLCRCARASARARASACVPVSVVVRVPEYVFSYGGPHPTPTDAGRCTHPVRRTRLPAPPTPSCPTSAWRRWPRFEACWWCWCVAAASCSRRHRCRRILTSPLLCPSTGRGARLPHLLQQCSG